MTAFGTRRAAEEFARLLEGSASGGSGASLAGVATAGRLRNAGMDLEGAVAPRPEFRDALRMRLVAVATVQPVTAGADAVAPAARLAAARRAVRTSARTSSRASAVAAGALASVLAVSGVAVAGSQSLPGDPFYDVKRAVEAFQLRAADGELEKGTRHLDFAATRLREVRGLALGRDAADAGPVLGPSALSAGITLSSSAPPLAGGDALSAPVAERLRETLAEMDQQTRDGTALLTRAYRTTQAPEPLRALTRFAVRQSQGLSQLIPALPPVTQGRARLSLSLLSGVTVEANELLGIGTCGTACDPAEAAPMLPGDPGAPMPAEVADVPCDCGPEPAPEPQASAEPPTYDQPEPPRQPAPETSSSPSPQPSPAAPSPSPSSGLLPPLPLPIPSLPVPIPTLTLAPAVPAGDAAGAAAESQIVATSRGGAAPVPAPEPASQPAPQLETVAVPPRR